MANIAHFMIPADNVDRAKHFHNTLLRRKIKPPKNPMDPVKMAAMQHHDIRTGAAKEGTMNTGGLYQRHMTQSILNFVMVEDIDRVLSKVEKLGGRITMPKEMIRGLWLNAVIQDPQRKCDWTLGSGGIVDGADVVGRHGACRRTMQYF